MDFDVSRADHSRSPFRCVALEIHGLTALTVPASLEQCWHLCEGISGWGELAVTGCGASTVMGWGGLRCAVPHDCCDRGDVLQHWSAGFSIERWHHSPLVPLPLVRKVKF